MTRRWRLVRAALDFAALVFLVWAWWFAVRAIADGAVARYAIDAHAYWSIDTASLYRGATVGELDAFLYSPAAGQLLDPVGMLPWPVFYAIWLAAILSCLVLLVGPIAAAALIFVPPIWADVTTGNIHVFLAIAIVLGLRWPAAWAAVLLTKVTPGIGLLWFAFRRDWRALWIAVGTTAIIATISLMLAPNLWSDWVGVLGANTTEPPRFFGWPLATRLTLAAVVVAIGAWRGWLWCLPLAAALALPVLWGNSLTLLLAIVPLLGLGPLGRFGRLTAGPPQGKGSAGQA
ncbi:MAG: glycosyltransferase 87 family protein [Chloroflexota bacterium]